MYLVVIVTWCVSYLKTHTTKWIPSAATSYYHLFSKKVGGDSWGDRLFSDRYFLGGAPVKKTTLYFPENCYTRIYIRLRIHSLHIIFQFIEKCYTRIKLCLPLCGVSFFKRRIFLRSFPHHPNDGGRFRHLIQCSWENDINYYNQDKCPD